MAVTADGKNTVAQKPLNHFLPGSAVLSFGTAGYNLWAAPSPGPSAQLIPKHEYLTQS